LPWPILLKSVQKGIKTLEIFLSTQPEGYRRLASAILEQTIEAHGKKVREELHQLPASTTRAQVK
jgi:hypothetical protein